MRVQRKGARGHGEPMGGVLVAKIPKPSCAICVHRAYSSSAGGTSICCSMGEQPSVDVSSAYAYDKFSKAASVCPHYGHRLRRTEFEDMLESQLLYNGIGFVREFTFKDSGKMAWDFAIENAKLLVEVNGKLWQKGGHSSGAGIIRDYKKLMIAQMHGWAEFMVASQHVADGTALQWILDYANRDK